MGTSALAIQRFAAIRTVTAVRRHVGRVRSTLRGNVVFVGCGHAVPGFVAVARHGLRRDGIRSHRNSMGRYTLVTWMGLGGMSQWRHYGLPEEQYRRQGCH